MKYRPASKKKIYVILTLLAVLFILMGYLSMQRREGMIRLPKWRIQQIESLLDGCKDDASDDRIDLTQHATEATNLKLKREKLNEAAKEYGIESNCKIMENWFHKFVYPV